MAQVGHTFKVGDIVRDVRDGQHLRIAHIYDGCDEVVVETWPGAEENWDALYFDLELVSCGGGPPHSEAK